MYYKAHPFKMYNSVIFNTFTVVTIHNHHLNLILEHFHHTPQKSLYLFLLIPSHPPALALQRLNEII